MKKLTHVACQTLFLLLTVVAYELIDLIARSLLIEAHVDQLVPAADLVCLLLAFCAAVCNVKVAHRWALRTIAHDQGQGTPHIKLLPEPKQTVVALLKAPVQPLLLADPREIPIVVIDSAFATPAKPWTPTESLEHLFTGRDTTDDPIYREPVAAGNVPEDPQEAPLSGEELLELLCGGVIPERSWEKSAAEALGYWLQSLHLADLDAKHRYMPDFALILPGPDQTVGYYGQQGPESFSMDFAPSNQKAHWLS